MLEWNGTRKWMRILVIVVFCQILGICISLSGVFSQLLVVKHDVSVPFFQSSLNYLFLALIFTPVLVLKKRGDMSALKDVYVRKTIMYAGFALVDVMANYLVVVAYYYTSLTSVQLLDCFTIPSVILLSYIVLHHRYKPMHYVGVIASLLGAVLLIISDFNAAESKVRGQNPALGDMLVLAGAFLYAVSNIAQESTVKNVSATEYLAMVGLYGFIVSLILSLIFENKTISAIGDWDNECLMLILAFNICLLFVYMLVPIFLKLSSAAVLNIGLLSADVYSLIFGVYWFHYAFSYVYILSITGICLGVIIFNVPDMELVDGDGRNKAYSVLQDHEVVSDEEVEECVTVPMDVVV